MQKLDGGTSSQPPGGPQLIRNTVLIVVSGLGVLLSSRAAVHPAGVAVTLAASAVLLLLAVGTDDLAVLFDSPELGSQQ